MAGALRSMGEVDISPPIDRADPPIIVICSSSCCGGGGGGNGACRWGGGGAGAGGETYHCVPGGQRSSRRPSLGTHHCSPAAALGRASAGSTVLPEAARALNPEAEGQRVASGSSAFVKPCAAPDGTPRQPASVWQCQTGSMMARSNRAPPGSRGSTPT